MGGASNLSKSLIPEVLVHEGNSKEAIKKQQLKGKKTRTEITAAGLKFETVLIEELGTHLGVSTETLGGPHLTVPGLRIQPKTKDPLKKCKIKPPKLQSEWPIIYLLTQTKISTLQRKRSSIFTMTQSINMFSIQSKITRHVKKEENVIQGKKDKQSI